MMKCSFPTVQIVNKSHTTIYVDTISYRNHVVADLLPSAHADR